MLRPTLAVLVASLCASAGWADEPHVSLNGTGLITLPSTATLRPGHGTFGVDVDNRDRDPLSLDVSDYSVMFGLGLTRRVELYGHAVVSRVVAVPALPVLPPPPLDLIVPPHGVVPSEPYHLLYWPVPYANKRGHNRFDAFVPGDAVGGAKWRFADQKGLRPALAMSFELKVPLRSGFDSLQSGSSTDATDETGRGILEWKWGHAEIVATAAYVRTGQPSLGDRVIEAHRRQATVTDLPLIPPDRLETGLGIRRPLSRHWALAGELFTTFNTGTHTPLAYDGRPFDVIGGPQWQSGRLWATVAVRYEAHVPSPQLRPTPLAGLIDVSGVAPNDLASYLDAVGASSAYGMLRPDTQRLIALTSTDVPLPSGARVIPPEYRVRADHLSADHGWDYVIAFGFSF